MENSSTGESNLELQQRINENTPINTTNKRNYTNPFQTTKLDGVFENEENIELNAPVTAPTIEMPFYKVISTNFEQFKSILAGKLIFGLFPWIKSKSTFRLGLLLLSCCGLHIVWAIFQVLFYETSKRYVASLKNLTDVTHTKNMTNVLNESKNVTTGTHLSMLNILTYNSYGFMLVTVTAWCFGIIIGCGLSGYYLLSTMRKKNIYVRFSKLLPGGLFRCFIVEC